MYVYHSRGLDDAIDWGTGYLLEWMLSIDNLFVFHRVFAVFHTPDEQKHKPLFYGIVGAIFFRMIFFMIEEFLIRHITWMHFIFGAFLIYTGIKAVGDDEDDSPKQGHVYQFLERHIYFVDQYDENGSFFCKVQVNAETGEVVPQVEPHQKRVSVATPRWPSGVKDNLSTSAKEDEEAAAFEPARSMSFPAGAISPSPMAPRSQFSFGVPPTLSPAIESTGSGGSTEVQVVERWRATRLVLVVVCLELTDLVFAVDSVSAIIAQIPDLYLAYTACVFAMLGLRALYFAIDELVKLFSLLQYGVAAILIFLGVKLIMRSWFHIPPLVVCGILLTTLAISIIASLVKDGMGGCDDDKIGGLSPRENGAHADVEIQK